MAKVKVLVADEKTLLRAGVGALLENCDDIEIVGEATNGQEVIEMVREKTPDVVLMNIAMPIVNGTEVTQQIRKENSKVKVVLFTQYEDRDHVLRGLKAGADGCIPMNATASDLASAIRVVYRGGYFLYPSLARMMVEDYFQHIKQPGNVDPYDRLTHREKEVLRLLAEGRKTGEIANLLNMAVKTALGHRTNIMRKLDIHSRTELVKYAIRRHLVNLGEG